VDANGVHEFKTERGSSSPCNGCEVSERESGKESRAARDAVAD